ncbi:MAG: SCO family protein [Flavisolibacter sp.]
MNRHLNSIWFFVAAVVLIPVTVFGIVNWLESNFKQLPVFGEAGHRVEDFKMFDQNNKPVSARDWDHKIVVANFFFTHCITICPKMTVNLKAVQQSFANNDQVLINSFTVDPGRDSSSRLLEYSKQFGIGDHHWSLLTGDKKEIYRLARKSFLVVATDGDGGPNDFIHTEKLVLIDSEKRIRGYYNGTSESEVSQLIKDIRKLRKEIGN